MDSDTGSEAAHDDPETTVSRHGRPDRADGAHFALLTLTVVRGVIIHIPIADRSEEVRAIAEQAANAYAEHGNSWLRAAQGRRLEAAILGERQDSSVLLVSADGSVVLHAGDESAGMIRRFGVHERVERDGVRIGDLYYYDEEAARLKIIQLGVGDHRARAAHAARDHAGAARRAAAARRSGPSRDAPPLAGRADPPYPAGR